MIENYKLLETLLLVTWLLFAFAFGSCVGSLINVLVYRLPLGLDVVSPSSRCPSCDTLLTWRENVPVLGWLMLKGRCRFCKSAISPEYPLVETFVGLLFAGLFALWFVLPNHDPGVWAGLDLANLAPEWTRNRFGLVWPTYVMTVLLLSSLTAMTLIDARTFHIPLVLTWIPMGLGLVGHTLHAVWIGSTRSALRYTAEGHWWMIPTSDPRGWAVLGLAIGAGVGLLVAAGLQKLGVLKQSYADYAQWEASLDEQPEPMPAPKGPVSRVWRAVSATIAAGVLAGCIAWLAGGPAWLWGLGGSALALPVFARLTTPKLLTARPESEADIWMRYPHARREALRELLWLVPAIALGALGAQLGARYGAPPIDPFMPGATASHAMPLWLHVFGASLLGLLVGGGLIWAIRIFGSLAFGKEAMGMGDAWLMAAVGACLGWMDATLVFFIAPFLALYMTAVLWSWDGAAKRALPYGPALAGATLLVVIAERGFEWGLGRIWGTDGPFMLP